MSAKVDKPFHNLPNRLNNVETRLQAVKTNVQSLAGQAEKTLRQKSDELHRKAQTEKGLIERLQESLKVKARQKVVETNEVVRGWKAQNETRQLNARADRAEAYAAEAIELAVAATNKAAEAIVDAAVARMDADEAK